MASNRPPDRSSQPGPNDGSTADGALASISEPPSSTANPTDDSPPSRTRAKVKVPRPKGPRVNPNLEGKTNIRGSHVGDRYVRVVRQPRDAEFRLVAPGHLIAGEEASSGRGPVQRAFGKIKRVLIGNPLTTSSGIHERLTKVKALAVFSSDALSSVAYATEEILRVLLLAGLGAMTLSLPIGGAIIALLFIVGISYRQTIRAYPNGGGSYIVAKDNLGETPALIAGGALLLDYILTVAVSISAAVAAMVSAVPEVHDHLVLTGIGLIVLVTMLNLRGIRESGTIFALPTYLFLIGMAVMLSIGFVRNALDGFPVQEPSREAMIGTGSVGIFLILRAFSSGCAALTGIEAISDGVPAFKKPEWMNARTTLTWMLVLLATMFGGITWLAHQYGSVPLSQHESGYETVVSQIARTVFGGTNAAYYYIQFATMAILVLAANTAYSDFPRLAYFMARDRYMPSQFTFRGDRLAFTTGILTLGLMSILVLSLFGGQTERLIPLYALGVFTSFTLSQLGMVVRWQRRKEPGWRQGRLINAVGATATAIVALVVGVTKFTTGAWIIVILIPLLIMLFRAIHTHYADASKELASLTPIDSDDIQNVVVVPVASINAVTRQTLAYARSISESVSAIHISDDEAEIEQMREQWHELNTDVSLVIIESPYRSLVGPLLTYLDELQDQAPSATLTVVLPEYVPRHWWEQILHNQTAFRIKAALLFRPGTVVISVPYHLERHRRRRPSAQPFQRRL
ncbi:MAG: APC family permease [Chloroflexia bacterium]|nr:APC family permease [Chloroflexia bacterium]